ncbi:MAG TPA: peptide deformylase [Candidatus Cloacimonadota bacterium]|nr:peptide deformylase [Candidatus Cloacimonadota bacterium]
MKPRLLPIRILGDEILRRKLQEVKTFDAELRDFVADLTHTMYERDGVGLAANQVGKDLRIFVMDATWTRDHKGKNPRVMINPVIEESSGESVNEEGCISIPDLYADVTRPSSITYSYYDIEGNKHREMVSGFPAIVFQHEYDHLDGILFIDKINSLTKLKLKRKLREIEKSTVDGVNIRVYEEQD